MSGPVTQGAARQLRQQIAGWGDAPSLGELEGALRLLAKWRSQVLGSTLVSLQGTVVQGGLFAGMDYAAAATEGSLTARLLGVYEGGLQPHIRSIVAEGLDCVIDVGCAEGYYAVGMARTFPELTVYAHDISEAAREACAALAAKNGVGDRVLVGAEFKPTDFEAFADRRVLAIVDAEGAELEVLQPALSPALAQMSLIVETHDVWRPGALAEISRRFQPTHDIVRVDQRHEATDLPQWLMGLSELDQLIAVWEWRHRLTPWLVMRPRRVA